MQKKFIHATLIALLIAVTSYAQTYVAVTGNDVTGTGTSANPYKTISKGIQSTAAGGTVLVSGGTYNITAGLFIDKALTLKKNGTTEVIVNAASWVGTGKYMLAIVNTSNVTVDGFTFANNIGNGSKGAWVLSNNTTGTRNNVVIKNCSFENIGWISNNLTAIPANSGIVANAIKVEGQTSAAITNVTLLNNNVENCATGWGEAVTVTGNVNGFTVQGNFVFDIANIGIVIAGNYTNTGAPSNVNQARNGTVIGNEVHHCMSAIANSPGIYLDGAYNCRVEKNEVYQCGVGLSVGGEQPVGSGANVPGNHVINNNEVYNNCITGIYIGTNLAGNAIQNTKIFNNTFYKNRTGAVINGVTTIAGQPVADAASIYGGEVHLQNIASSTFKNNIVYATTGKKAFVALAGYTVANYVSNYNLYFRDVNTDFMFDLTGISFNGNTTTGAYATLAAFTTQTGQDINSVVANPLFVNAAIFNFYLQSTSLARNKADVTYDTNASGTTDFGYATRRREGRLDIGCLEYQTGTSGRPAAPVITAAPAFKIYPNPATEYIMVNLDKKVEKGNIIVFDAAGRIIMNRNIVNSVTERIDLNTLHTKSQLLMIKIADGINTTIHKVVVQ